MPKRVVQVNVITYAISAVGMLAVAAGSWFVPESIGAFQQPIPCWDYSIRNPKKLQRIPTMTMIIVTIVVGLLTIPIVEVFMHFKAKSDVHFKFRKWFLLPLLVHIFAHIGYFCIGYTMQLFLLQVAKYSIGRLRPHFYSVCWPKIWNDPCTGKIPGQLIYDYKCTGEKRHIDEARLSFFSGHSSLSVYTAVFLSLYLHARIGARLPRALLAFIQTFLISSALYIAFTRIEDYYHHPTDVLTGSLVGFFGAIFTCYFWAEFFPKNAAYNPTHVKQFSQEEGNSNPEVHIDNKTSKKTSSHTSKHDKHSSTNQPSSSDQPVPEIPAPAKTPKIPGNDTTIVAQTEYANTPSVATAVDVTQTVTKGTQPPSSS